LLDHLHQCAAKVSGDPRNHSLVQRFLHAATIPYFKMVTAWISSGELQDMFEEFMVQEIFSSQAVCQDAGTWERRFTMRSRNGKGTPDVPRILEPVADAVLQAGTINRHCLLSLMPAQLSNDIGILLCLGPANAVCKGPLAKRRCARMQGHESGSS
jgi:hypothetical protein